jgi:hypothetical protein
MSEKRYTLANILSEVPAGQRHGYTMYEIFIRGWIKKVIDPHKLTSHDVEQKGSLEARLQALEKTYVLEQERLEHIFFMVIRTVWSQTIEISEIRQKRPHWWPKLEEEAITVWPESLP